MMVDVGLMWRACKMVVDGRCWLPLVLQMVVAGYGPLVAIGDSRMC